MSDIIKEKEKEAEALAKNARYSFKFANDDVVELDIAPVVKKQQEQLKSLAKEGCCEALEVLGKGHPESAERLENMIFKRLIQKPVERGVKAQRQNSKAGFSSGEQRQAERAPAWQLWQQAIDEVIAAHPDNKNKKFACNTAAKRYPELAKTGLSADGARRHKHINWPESYSRR